MLKPSEMPAPDALIEYPNGCLGVAMFHFAHPDDDGTDIVREHGFEFGPVIEMHDDLPEGHPVRRSYYESHDFDLSTWQPSIPPGWQIGYKGDTEDGPVVKLIRRVKPAQS